jgi:hypothetical protein
MLADDIEEVQEGPGAALVRVVARPHPFGRGNVSALVPAGHTLADIVGSGAMNCRIEVGGVAVAEVWWGRVRPKPGTLVTVTRFPQGGHGGGWKMVFRLLAFAALAVVTYGIAAGVAWMPEFIQGLSAGWAAATAAAVGLGGSLLINALIPPASTGVAQATAPLALKGISGVQNAADPYGAITCVFGTVLLYPKLAAAFYTEIAGDDQYLRCLFDLGYGSLDYAALQIGTDDLANFTGVEYEVGTSPSLFTQDIAEVAAGDLLNTDLDLATHTTGINADEVSLDFIFPSGLFAVNSSGKTITATCNLRVEYQDLNAPGAPTSGGISAIPLVSQGAYFATPGLTVAGTVTITGDGFGAAAVATFFQIGYNSGIGALWGVSSISVTSPGTGYSHASASLSVTGAVGGGQSAILGVPDIAFTGGSWLNAMGATGLSLSSYSATSNGTNLVIKSAEQKTLRIGVRWKLPARSEFNIQVTRVSTDYQGAGANARSGDLAWTVLRTIRHTVPSSTPSTKLAMRIKASDQLNGTINTFNLLVSQVVPVWNGTNWIDGQTSNPAWLYRWLLRDCPANPRRVDASRIDDEALKEWGSECDLKGFTFNYANDQVTTIFSLLQILCACGRGSFNPVDGKYSVIRDVAQTTPVQIFTPRNTANFQGTRAFVDVVHALRVQFINPEANYQQDEIVVYDDLYDATNATKFEQLQIPGCSDAEMAWKLGRYHLAVARLRPNTYSWTTDVEHLICNRGDLIFFAHDVISVGLGWGRVKAISVDGSGHIAAVTVDEPQALIYDPAKTYAMRFRAHDGVSRTVSVIFASDAEVRDFIPSPFVVPASNINPGDLFLFGLAGQDHVPMLVKAIEPTSDLAAKITAVDSAPDVLTADSGYTDSTATFHLGLPTLVSSITGQAWLEPPPAPQFVIVTSSQTQSSANDQGATNPVMVVAVG